jgi:hypothetical protein
MHSYLLLKQVVHIDTKGFKGLKLIEKWNTHVRTMEAAMTLTEQRRNCLQPATTREHEDGTLL